MTPTSAIYTHLIAPCWGVGGVESPGSAWLAYGVHTSFEPAFASLAFELTAMGLPHTAILLETDVLSPLLQTSAQQLLRFLGD